MRKIKQILALVFAFYCLITGTVTASADSISVFVDGKIVSFDVSPQLIGGRTMVPLRAIFESLGATVNWDEATKTVTAFREDAIVAATIGAYEMRVNGESRTIDVPPMIVNDRTLVPARFVAEALGCDVQWEANSKSVYITSKVIDYSKVEQETNIVPENDKVDTALGTLKNPYAANAGETIEFNEYSFEPTRNVKIICSEANAQIQLLSLKIDLMRMHRQKKNGF